MRVRVRVRVWVRVRVKVRARRGDRVRSRVWVRVRFTPLRIFYIAVIVVDEHENSMLTKRISKNFSAL